MTRLTVKKGYVQVLSQLRLKAGRLMGFGHIRNSSRRLPQHHVAAPPPPLEPEDYESMSWESYIKLEEPL